MQNNMLRGIVAALLVCLISAHPGIAEEIATEDAAASEDTRAIKVKTRTQKLAEACGVFDEAVQACSDLRKACKKPVNSSKDECVGLPPKTAEATE